MSCISSPLVRGRFVGLGKELSLVRFAVVDGGLCRVDVPLRVLPIKSAPAWLPRQLLRRTASGGSRLTFLTISAMMPPPEFLDGI